MHDANLDSLAAHVSGPQKTLDYTLRRRRFLSLLCSSVIFKSASFPAFAKSGDGPLKIAFDAGGRKVYVTGETGIPLVLLHELNGLSPGCLMLAERLAGDGFRVYMPLLFGHAEQDNAVLGWFEACWLGPFSCYRATEDSAASGIVRQVCDRVAQESGAARMGVIGMCLSGGLPISVMSHPKVRAVVLSQPALPLGNSAKAKRELGISLADFERAKQSGVPVLAFRFEADTLSTEPRLKTIESRLAKGQFRKHEFPSSEAHPPKSHRLHAVLTGGFHPASEEAYQEMLRFLKQNLA